MGTPPNCTICDNRETNWQKQNGFDCATDSVRMNNKCNKDAKWTQNGFCRLSCYNAGNGYPGDVCCDETLDRKFERSLVVKVWRGELEWSEELWSNGTSTYHKIRALYPLLGCSTWKVLVFTRGRIDRTEY